MKNILAPSLLSADFANLEDALKIVSDCAVNYIHLDVMDGMFVPSISFGIPVIKSLRAKSDLTFDVHLMIEDPDRYLESFKNAGADIISVHAEATKHLDRTLNKIKELGLKAAVAINPSTPIEDIRNVLPICDMVLLMSVNPGFGGQKYIGYVTNKIEELDALRSRLNLSFDIEVDGGVTLDNAKMILDAGANILVAGSAVFNGDIKENILLFNEILND